MARRTKPQRAELCPIHAKPGIVTFPCCVGAAGGSSRSPKKIAAVRANIGAYNERRKREAAERKRRA